MIGLRKIVLEADTVRAELRTDLSMPPEYCNLKADILTLLDEFDTLKAFKTYVHKRLDDANVPTNPEPESNREHGCRIEGRLNHILQQRDTYKEALEKIGDPRKRDHQEPDAYTQLGCVMNIANEALEKIANKKEK